MVNEPVTDDGGGLRDSLWSQGLGPLEHMRLAYELAHAADPDAGSCSRSRCGSSAGDDALLSTAHERETCYIAVHQFNRMEFETYFRAVEAIMNEYGGRPHWGKRHYQTADTLKDRYPEWDRFQAVRARLDPHGAFTNDYCRRVLGPVHSAVPAA